MYPQQELTRLAVGKAVLRLRITRHRLQCAQAATRVTQPLAWLDRMLAFWRRLSPFAQYAALPLGFLLKRPPDSRPRLLGTLLRWGPFMLGAIQGLTGGRSRSRRD